MPLIPCCAPCPSILTRTSLSLLPKAWHSFRVRCRTDLPWRRSGNAHRPMLAMRSSMISRSISQNLSDERRRLCVGSNWAMSLSSAMARRDALWRLPVGPCLDFNWMRLRRPAPIKRFSSSRVFSVHTWFASRYGSGCDNCFHLSSEPNSLRVAGVHARRWSSMFRVIRRPVQRMRSERSDGCLALQPAGAIQPDIVHQTRAKLL